MIQKLNTFSINYYSEMEQRDMSGKFTARIASFMDRTKINVRRSQLLGGMYCVRDAEGNPTGRGVDEDTEGQAMMLAHLETVLVQKPDWWKLEGESQIVDDAVIWMVFAEVIKYEKTFRDRGRPTAEGSEGSAQGSEGAGAPQPPRAVGTNNPQKVVDREVQAALEP
jgi:hypothetical protein